jgi:hypothetical protein
MGSGLGQSFKPAFLNRWIASIHFEAVKSVQVSLGIRGRYVPLFWTVNTEFADKKTYFDWKFGILYQFLKCE